MPITRTPIINDDLSGKTGTILDNAWKQELYDQIDARWTVLPYNGAGGDIATGDADFVLFQNLADIVVTGFSQSKPGKRLTCLCASSGIVRFQHFAAGVTPADQLGLFVTSAPMAISGSGGTATFVYGGSFWYMTQHEQGVWITPPYSAALFNAQGGTWTVQATDMAAMQYRLSARTLFVNFVLATTSVTAGTSILQINNGAWGGYQIAPQTQAVAPVVWGPEPGDYALVGSGYPTLIMLFRVGNQAFAAATDSMSMYAQLSFPVT